MNRERQRGADSCLTLLLYGYNEVLVRHQSVLCHVACESSTQMCLSLKFIVKRSVVVVGVREDAIDSSSHGAESLHRVVLDRDATWKVLVAV